MAPTQTQEGAEEAPFTEGSPGPLISHNFLTENFPFVSQRDFSIFICMCEILLHFVFFGSTGIDGLEDLKLISGIRAHGTTFRTKKDDKVIKFLLLNPDRVQGDL